MRLLRAAVLAVLPLAFASPAQHPFISEGGADTTTAFTSSLQGLKLSDALTVDKRATMFYSYARDYSSISSRLSSSLQKSTLVVPTDDVILALHKKPHQGRPAAADGVEVTDEKDASEYLEQWLKRHVVPQLVDSETGDETYDSLLKGHTVQFAKDDQSGQWTINPGSLHIVDTIEASNGLVVLVDGTLPVD